VDGQHCSNGHGIFLSFLKEGSEYKAGYMQHAAARAFEREAREERKGDLEEATPACDALKILYMDNIVSFMPDTQLPSMSCMEVRSTRWGYVQFKPHNASDKVESKFQALA
jgi:hypothetical protein